MVGAIVIVVALVALAASICMAGAVIAAALGTSLKADAEARHEGSELADLDK